MFREEVAKILEKHLSIDKNKIIEILEVPPESKLGDYAFPCFILAKDMKKKPNEIAQQLASEIEAEGKIARIECAGPYLNFYIEDFEFVKQALSQPENKKDDRTVIIEYSSPNIAKPFHIGHLRSTVIGNSLKKTYEKMGWNTIGINHLGDWGTQFGNLIAAYKKWPVDLEEEPIKNLMEIYVKFNEEAKSDESLVEEGRRWFKRLEDGDEEAVEIWKKFRELSIDEFKKIYSQMGVEFDHYHGESFYTDKMDKVINELKGKGLLVGSEGAMIVDLEEYGITPMIVVKSDGATTYATRDLAGAIYRKNEFNFDRMIYEVGSEQSLHFQQVFKVLELMGHDWISNCSHVKHGIYKFGDKKMSTRKGEVVFIKDLIEESRKRVMKIIEEKNPELDNKEEVSHDVGVGAIVFNDLKNDRVKDVNFDWEEILSFEGDTGPYLQYTHARIASILRKSDEKPAKKPDLLKTEEEAMIARHITKYDETLENVIKDNKPHHLCRWLLDLAQLFNNYYQKQRIIQDDKELESARLGLIETVKEYLKDGLGILGIKSPEEM